MRRSGLAKEVVNQVVAELEVEVAGVLVGVLGVGVVGDEVGGTGGGVEIEVAAEAVLPAGVADELDVAVGVDEEAGGDLVLSSGARLKVVFGRNGQ